MNRGLIFMGMGFELVALILGGLYIGSLVDKEMNWPGYGVAGAMVCVLASWMWHLVVLLKRFMEKDESNGA